MRPEEGKYAGVDAVIGTTTCINMQACPASALPVHAAEWERLTGSGCLGLRALPRDVDDVQKVSHEALTGTSSSMTSD